MDKTNMRTETLIEDDIPNLLELQPAEWGDIIPYFKFYTQMPYCIPVKIEKNFQIVGVGAAIILDKTAWLAHIIVSSNYRQQGLGSTIVTELISHLKLKKCKTISLTATELGRPVYKKLGFMKQTEYIFFERESPITQQPLSDHIYDYSDDFMSDILDLDRTVSGENRDKILIDKAQNSFVYHKEGHTLGFYLPDLGDGLIIATTKEAGTELMKLKYSNYNKGVLPSDNKVGINFLKHNNYKETKRMQRMFLGEEFSWEPKNIYSRIGGHLG